MCRHLAHLGPPVALGTLLFDAPHSLSDQAAHPRHQTPGRINEDGWGVGWFVDGEADPRAYRTVTAMWRDTAFAGHAVTASAFVAAARHASPGASLHPSGNAPFAADGWLFSLNGYAGDFREGVGEELRAGISDRRLAAVAGDSDTEVLFAMVLDRLDRGDDPARALAGTVETVAARSRSKLNLLLVGARTGFATRFGNSLFARDTTIVSEPLDDADTWEEIPEHSLVCATLGHVQVVSL
jgi:gamma-glutamyl hercynylcysteine S-oxide hydrolase